MMVDTEDVEIGVPLKYLSDFYRTFEMQQIDCHTKVIQT